jgi:hypothetical protein
MVVVVVVVVMVSRVDARCGDIGIGWDRVGVWRSCCLLLMMVRSLVNGVSVLRNWSVLDCSAR